MARYALIPEFDYHKSFHDKARVVVDSEGQTLYSYGTKVARITNDNRPEVYGTYSATTLRHIKEFLRQNGVKADTKSQIIADYNPEFA